jgi:hypothetical protein
METTVITSAYYKDIKPISKMLESAKRVGITVEPYGLGRPYGGFMESKCVDIITVLKHIKTKYVLYVDGADVLFRCGLDEIEQRYKAISPKGGIVVAGDHDLHPFHRKQKWFIKRAPQRSLFPYPCAGVFMAKPRALIRAFTAMLALRKEIGHMINDKWYENDQGWWILAMTWGRMVATLDYGCQISVSLHHYKRNWFWEGQSPTKMADGTTPAIIHFNGASIRSSLYWSVCKEIGIG